MRNLINKMIEDNKRSREASKPFLYNQLEKIKPKYWSKKGSVLCLAYAMQDLFGTIGGYNYLEVCISDKHKIRTAVVRLYRRYHKPSRGAKAFETLEKNEYEKYWNWEELKEEPEKENNELLEDYKALEELYKELEEKYNQLIEEKKEKSKIKKSEIINRTTNKLNGLEAYTVGEVINLLCHYQDGSEVLKVRWLEAIAKKAGALKELLEGELGE